MAWQAWLTLIVVGVLVVALVRDFVAPVVGVVGALIFLLVVGILTPAQAFAGFGNPAPITVAALYVVARAVDKTAALQPLIAGALGSRGGLRSSLLRLIAPSAVASAFLNNTPIVAMLAPQVRD